MRIRILSDGRVFQGTAQQIVEQMHFLAFGKENRSLSEYVDWLVDQIQRMESISITVKGENDAEKAASMVQAMLETGLAEKM